MERRGNDCVSSLQVNQGVDRACGAARVSEADGCMTAARYGTSNDCRHGMARLSAEIASGASPDARVRRRLEMAGNGRYGHSHLWNVP